MKKVYEDYIKAIKVIVNGREMIFNGDKKPIPVKVYLEKRRAK